MEQKAIVVVEVTKNERLYRFELPVGAPFGEAYDSCFEILHEILSMAQKAKDSAKRQESESQPEAN
jgi:hypothetical protein